ncbi:hypothetical protein Y032_0035g2968 [Ancylostoma ceylanicum]|uniref:Uncharacterized protein n=1 Tax=Ancylostoma ceylanicum TaxID=53326 RepID=A0A016ULL8_9BILA|nr:hypothetical protein Y032_0035g2968 [Ancylostoma ceylanicum]
MVSARLHCKGIIPCEVLPRYTAIMMDLYCQRLDRIAAKVTINYPNHGTIRFLHYTARPLTIRVTRQKLLDFEWEMLTPPPYRPGLAPENGQLPLTLSNILQGKTYKDENDLDCWLSKFFVSVSYSCMPKASKRFPRIGKE